MQACRQQKLIQNHNLPSFLCTNTTALHQALWLGLTAPDSNISCRWLLTSSTNGGGIHLKCFLKGMSLLVTFMVCSVEWVEPNLAGFNENTSWYLARSWCTASTHSGAQESRLLKFNSSNNLPCLCLTVSLGVGESCNSSTPYNNCSPSGSLGTGDAATTLATRVFFPQLSVHVLHSEALWQGNILSSQGLYHDINAFSHICPPCPHWYNMRREGSMVSSFWVYINCS